MVSSGRIARKASFAHALLTADEVRRADAAAVESGIAISTLMHAAGTGLADAASRMLPAGGGRCLVLCGPGNNGGDGFVAARRLQERGVSVSLAAIPGGTGEGAAKTAASEWTGPVLAPEDAAPEDVDLVVDAVFGTGLARDLDGRTADLIRRVNAAGRPVLAADIPSGIDADTGRVRGEAVRATRTVAFACRKPGHLLYPGRGFCGEVEVAEIGMPAAIIEEIGPRIAANAPGLWLDAYPRPGADGHKYDRGHALVVSGGPANTGAARMAARGALRIGAGLVSVVTSARALSVNASHLTAIMLRVCDDPDEFADLLTDDRFNALALGPALGVGETTRRWVEAALEADRGTVLDADALTSFAGDADAFAALTRGPRDHPVVLTPHQGEFKRLFSGRDEASADARAIPEMASKVEAARAAAAFTGATTVFKGADTVVASPDGRAVINGNGSPYLGTAGSGDVLGGMIAGLLAQGMPGFEAASAAVWLHAEAGARFGPGLIAEDLPDLIPGVLREMLT